MKPSCLGIVFVACWFFFALVVSLQFVQWNWKSGAFGNFWCGRGFSIVPSVELKS